MNIHVDDEPPGCTNRIIISYYLQELRQQVVEKIPTVAFQEQTADDIQVMQRYVLSFSDRIPHSRKNILYSLYNYPLQTEHNLSILHTAMVLSAQFNTIPRP